MTPARVLAHRRAAAALGTLALPLALIALGCAPHEPIPTYPPADPHASLQIIRDRWSQRESISGSGAITLDDAKAGGAARLDAAFVFAPPDRARVRAWKFGQAVLDLTVTGEATWLYVPRGGGDDRAAQLRAASADAGRAVRDWLGLLFGELDAPGASVTASASKLLVTRPARDGALRLVCTIDRATLTPRRYELIDPLTGQRRFDLTLAQYRQAGPTVWPMQIVATSESGRIIVEMRDVRIDDAPPDAFRPPARAERLQ